jgi:replicative DNA helicase
MQEQELDSLKKYGAEFQNKCIAAILSDKAFLERVADILSPDYFETSAQKWVVEKTLEYFLKYREIPTATVMAVQIKAIDDGMKILKQSLGDLLGSAFGYCSETDQKYVKEQFLEFCKIRKLAEAILKSVEHLKRKEYETINQVINEALKAGMERNLGHDYFRDVDKRMENVARDCIKTNWDLLDQLMDGGLGKGELGFIVAPAGSGKTWVLCKLGAEAIKQGKNVVHVTLELNENYVGRRYDACLTGISFQKVAENKDVVKQKLSGFTAKHFIKYYPLKTISASSVKLFVERLQMIENIKVDLLIVDYADILRPAVPDKNANSYNEAGSVYEELRAVAGELQIPVWSASQSNRGGHEEEILQAHNVADSYRKIMTGDFILSLSRKMEDKNDGIGRIYVMKNRFGPDGLLFPCTFDTSNGNIHIYDKTSSEGMELLQKMKDGEKSIKKMTKGLWDTMMGDDANGSGSPSKKSP